MVIELSLGGRMWSECWAVDHVRCWCAVGLKNVWFDVVPDHKSDSCVQRCCSWLCWWWLWRLRTVIKVRYWKLKLLVRSRALFLSRARTIPNAKIEVPTPQVHSSAYLVLKDEINQHFNRVTRLVQEGDSVSFVSPHTRCHVRFFFEHMSTRMKHQITTL